MVLSQGHVDRWMSDALLDDSGEGEARGRVNTLIEVAALECADIQRFYGLPTREDEEEETSDARAIN